MNTQQNLKDNHANRFSVNNHSNKSSVIKTTLTNKFNNLITTNELSVTERNNKTMKTIKLNQISKTIIYIFFTVSMLLTCSNSNVYAQMIPDWHKEYDNGGYWDQAYYIAVHQNGDVYVTGESRSVNSPNTPNIATTKYYSNGQQAFGWPKRWHNPSLTTGVDVALGITIDAAENVYVTGFTQQPGGNFDIVTLKYDSDGFLLRTAIYNGTGNSTDFGNFICVDDNGMVYVAGISTGAGTGEDGILIKYDNNLQQQWVARYDGPAHGNDRFYGMTVSGSQWIFVTGMTKMTNGGTDFVTARYNTFGNGQPDWVRTYNGLANDSDWAFSIFNDPVHGGVVVTGPSKGVNTGMDYATIKYGFDGSVMWVRRYEGQWDDRPNRITSDRWGNIIVTGNSQNANTTLDCRTIKYDPQGNTLWGLNGVVYDNGYNDISNFVITDYDGNVYITGKSIGLQTGYDLLTVKYNFSGNQVWANRYYGSENNYNDEGAAIGIDGNNNVYVTGYVNITGQADYVTLKYAAGVTGIQTNNGEIPSEYKLMQNYPNPFNPTTSISYSLLNNGMVTLKIFDIAGNEISTLVNEVQNPGKYDIKWDASKYSSGVYFYKITTVGFTATKKMMLVK